MRTLCRVEEIPDGGARGFGPSPGGFTGLFVVRQGGAVFAYVNACPHIGASLDCMPGRFLTADGRLILCGTHGALFRIADGGCIEGPCEGEYLEAVAVDVRDGAVLVPWDAGL